jgi:uncharacterized protein (DUF1697 family)
MGLGNIRTYIQAGNAVFSAGAADGTELSERIKAEEDNACS